MPWMGFKGKFSQAFYRAINMHPIIGQFDIFWLIFVGDFKFWTGRFFGYPLLKLWVNFAQIVQNASDKS